MVELPEQIVVVADDAVTVGEAFTVIVRVAVPLQPAVVPVTVYVVVNNGLAVTVSLVVEFNPPEGDQE